MAWARRAPTVASCSGYVIESVEGEDPQGVLVGDLGDVLVGDATQRGGERFRTDGPCGVRMRVVTLPGDHVHIQAIAEATPKASSMKQVTMRSRKTSLGSLSPKFWCVHARWFL